MALGRRDRKQTPKGKNFVLPYILFFMQQSDKSVCQSHAYNPRASHGPRSNINVLYRRDFRSRPWDVPPDIHPAEGCCGFPEAGPASAASHLLSSQTGFYPLTCPGLPLPLPGGVLLILQASQGSWPWHLRVGWPSPYTSEPTTPWQGSQL